jgi:hypothetical protein
LLCWHCEEWHIINDVENSRQKKDPICIAPEFARVKTIPAVYVKEWNCKICTDDTGSVKRGIMKYLFCEGHYNHEQSVPHEEYRQAKGNLIYTTAKGICHDKQEYHEPVE